jgi:hypothetical protein
MMHEPSRREAGAAERRGGAPPLDSYDCGARSQIAKPINFRPANRPSLKCSSASTSFPDGLPLSLTTILAKKTHPGVARSIALSACRASDPLETARLYMKNYDRILKVVSRTDARRAHRVAAQAFRTDNPMRWAKRYLTELQNAESPKERNDVEDACS